MPPESTIKRRKMKSLTLQQVKEMYPYTQDSDWKQHSSGAWIHADAIVKDSIYLTIGPRVVFRGGTFKGGTFWGGTFEGAVIVLDADMVTLLNVAEYGPITAHKTPKGWVINCGCRHFTLTQAREHWADAPNREGTRQAVEILATFAAQRGW